MSRHEAIHLNSYSYQALTPFSKKNIPLRCIKFTNQGADGAVERGRGFGDFEADLKRSDSEPIILSDQKERFLTFMCSLNTFQSKNPTYTLSSLHFQLDEKRGKRAQNLKRRLSNPVLRYKCERREVLEIFDSSFQRQEMSFEGRDQKCTTERSQGNRKSRKQFSQHKPQCGG